MAVPVSETGVKTRSDTFPLISGGTWARAAPAGGFWRRVHRPALELQRQRRLSGGVGYRTGGQPVRQAGHAVSQYFVNHALGREGTVRILVTPELDTNRFDTLWNLDLRAAKTVKFGTRGSVQV